MILFYVLVLSTGPSCFVAGLLTAFYLVRKKYILVATIEGCDSQSQP